MSEARPLVKVEYTGKETRQFGGNFSGSYKWRITPSESRVLELPAHLAESLLSTDPNIWRRFDAANAMPPAALPETEVPVEFVPMGAYVAGGYDAQGNFKAGSYDAGLDISAQPPAETEVLPTDESGLTQTPLDEGGYTRINRKRP